MSTPNDPQSPSGWGEAPQPRYGQYGQGQYGQGQYGQGQYGQGQYGQQAPTPYGPSGYRPPAAKPGIVPLRPLTLGEVYDGAFGAIRHNPGVMLGAATLVLLIATVVGVLLGQLWVPSLTGTIDELATDVPELSGLSASYAQLTAGSAGTGITSILVAPVLEGVLTVSVSQSVVGRKLSVGEVWTRLRGRVWRLIGWSLLRGLAVTVGVFAYTLLAVLVVAAASEASAWVAVLLGILFAIGALALLVWLGARLGLVAPALALEGQRLWSTIPRAWRLTHGSFWRLFGIYLLAVVIVLAASAIVSYPFGLLGGLVAGTGASEVGAIAVTTLGSVVSSALVTIFLSAVVALLYVDMRMRREGLDVALAAAAAESTAARPGPR
jgi:glycerophosphoryl diester phosphodiesterase family protein